MKRFIKIALFLVTLQGFVGCSYLDVVPDNVRTIEHSFAVRNEARRYLHTCYSYLPQHGQLTSASPSFSGFEMWPLAYNESNTSRFVMGQQNVTSPLLNYWEGLMGGARPVASYT